MSVTCLTLRNLMDLEILVLNTELKYVKCQLTSLKLVGIITLDMELRNIISWAQVDHFKLAMI